MACRLTATSVIVIAEKLSVPWFRQRVFRSWLVYQYLCLRTAMSHAASESPCSSSSEIDLQREVIQQYNTDFVQKLRGFLIFILKL